jgi:maleylpyruvate isomerase
MTDLMPALQQHTASLLATAGSLRDLDHDSFCEGWTRAHVLAHLVSNGRGMVNLVAAAVDGAPATMYASQEQRDSDIEIGATRSPQALLTDLEKTCALALEALARLRPEHADQHVERTPGGRTFRVASLPYMRLREVIYHHVDLDAGFTFDDVDDELLTLFVDREVTQLARNREAPSVRILTDEGDSYDVGDDPTSTVSGPRAGVVLWLARRLPAEVQGTPELPHLPRGA